MFRAGSEDLTVLDGVSLEVREGSTVVISGESGSGKSTLLHLIGGLDAPTAGRILFHGLEITGLGEAELVEYRNRRLGFIFQLHYLLKDFTALENVYMPAAIAGAAGAGGPPAGRAPAGAGGSGRAPDALPHGAFRRGAPAGGRGAGADERPASSSWPTSRPAAWTSAARPRSGTCSSAWWGSTARP